MTTYYDWDRTRSYDAPETWVISWRTRGKTFGFRRDRIRDKIKRGHNFVEVVRHTEMIKGVDALQNGYFDKIDEVGLFPRHILKTHGTRAYIAPKPEDWDELDEDGRRKARPDWDLMGYFVSLSSFQHTKRRTFANVRTVGMDEFLLETEADQWHRYLPGEYELLMSVVSSCTRERADGPSPKLYLMANSASLVNPYFAHYGITREPPFGYSWWDEKNLLIHYERPTAEDVEAQARTVAGRRLAGSASGAMALENKFSQPGAEFFARKTSRARFAFGIAYHGDVWSAWLDEDEGLYYIQRGAPSDASPIYALTTRDSRINYVQAGRAQRALRGFVDLFYLGIVRYEDMACRDGFLKAMSLYGVR